MSELTNVFARNMRDLTTPTSTGVNPNTFDNAKIPIGNAPKGFESTEALTVKQLKDLASAGRKEELDAVTLKISTEEIRAKEVEAALINDKANKATTLSGYGITDAYTQGTIDSKVSTLESKKANKADVNTALSNLSTIANKYYSTLAAANADIANIALNQSVTIGEEANTGLWEKKTAGATSLTKSPYDPLTQSKMYVDSLTGGVTPNVFTTLKLTLDFINNKASIHNGLVAYGTEFLEITTPSPQVITLTGGDEEYPYGVRKICVHKTSGALRVFNALEKVTSDYILLGYLWLKKWYSVVDGLNPTIIADGIDTYESNINDLKYASDAEIVGGSLTINKSAKTISTLGCVVWSQTYRDFVYATNIQYSGELEAIVVDINTGGMKAIADGEVLSPSDIVIAIAVEDYLFASSINASFIQEGASKFIVKGKVDQNHLSSEPAFMSEELRLSIDFQQGKLSVIESGYLFANGGTIFGINDSKNINFSAVDPTYVRYLVYSLNSSTFKFDQNRTINSGNQEVLLGYVYNYKFYGFGNFNSKINITNSAGQIVEDESESPIFSEIKQRALMPNKLFFIEDRALPIYKDSVFSNSKAGLEKVRTWIDTNHAETIKRYVPVLQQTILNPQDLSNTIQFVYAHSSVADKRYWKNIAVNKAPQSKLTRSFNMLCFGDSLTQVGTPWTLKNKLESLGATVVPVGTFWSTETPNEVASEGRGYWNYRSFIGKDNYSSGMGVHTRSNGGKTRTAKFENPFLKLATTQDKTDHPDWCFRFTGSQKELSYAEDANKSGDFYIFDFEWYKTQHSVATPDFITIALSTNDINLDRDAYSRSEVMQYMQLGLEVMVKQIHKVLPNVPIGVIPCPAWSATASGYATFASDTATWVELCFKKVTELKTTHSNLEIVPVHLHMNRDMGYPIVNNVNLSNDSDIQVGVISDWVHYDQVGRDQYAEVVASWLANSI